MPSMYCPVGGPATVAAAATPSSDSETFTSSPTTSIFTPWPAMVMSSAHPPGSGIAARSTPICLARMAMCEEDPRGRREHRPPPPTGYPRGRPAWRRARRRAPRCSPCPGCPPGERQSPSRRGGKSRAFRETPISKASARGGAHRGTRVAQKFWTPRTWSGRTHSSPKFRILIVASACMPMTSAGTARARKTDPCGAPSRETRTRRGVHRQRPLRVHRSWPDARRRSPSEETPPAFVEIAAHADVANGELEHAESLVRGEARDGIALNLVAVKLIHRDVEQTDVAVDVLAVPPRPAEPLADLHDLIGYPRLVAVRQHVVDVVLDVLRHVRGAKVHPGVHVPRGSDAQDPVKVLHGIDQEGEVVAGTDDALGAPLPSWPRGPRGSACGFPRGASRNPPSCPCAKSADLLADVNVIHGGVAVQLLVPLLDERILDAGAMALLDAVLAHDLEDAETNVVAVAAALGKAGERPRDKPTTCHPRTWPPRARRDASPPPACAPCPCPDSSRPRTTAARTDGGEAESVAMMHAAPAGPACWDSLSLSLMRQNTVQRPAAGFSPLASALSTPAEDGVFKGTTRSPTSAWSQSALLRTTMPDDALDASPTPGGRRTPAFRRRRRRIETRCRRRSRRCRRGGWRRPGGGTTRRFPRRRTPSGARGCRPGG